MISTWKVDQEHSELCFKIKHLMISDISGYITSFNLDVQTEGNDFGQITDLQLTADSESVNTNNQKRDKHLRSVDFFDVENHPQVTFSLLKFKKGGMEPPTMLSVFRRDYKLYGYLTIKGITRNITLDGEFGGTAINSFGQKKAGFTVRGTICRKDFDMGWEGMTEIGKLVLADDIQIYGNIQLTKQDERSVNA